MMGWLKSKATLDTDAPNKSSENAFGEFASDSGQRISPGEGSWKSSEAQGEWLFSAMGMGIPNVCVVENTETTAGDAIHNLKYNLEMLLALRDHTHYYDPGSESFFRSYFKGRLEEIPKETVNAVKFSLAMGKNSLSGDMLSEVARAVGSIPITKEPRQAIGLITQLLSSTDPLVVDSMVVSLSDFEPKWIAGASNVKAAAARIPWPEIREEAVSVIQRLEE